MVYMLGDTAITETKLDTRKYLVKIMNWQLKDSEHINDHPTLYQPNTGLSKLLLSFSACHPTNGVLCDCGWLPIINQIDIIQVVYFWHLQ